MHTGNTVSTHRHGIALSFRLKRQTARVPFRRYLYPPRLDRLVIVAAVCFLDRAVYPADLGGRCGNKRLNVQALPVNGDEVGLLGDIDEVLVDG